MQSQYTTNRGLPWEPDTLKAWAEEHAGPFKWKGYEGQTRCRLPGHDGQDQNPSFGFNAEKGTGHCFACHAAGEGLSVKELATAWGCEPPPMKQVDQSPPVKRRIVKTYDYVSATGELVYQSCRFEPKGFSQRRPDGNGGWIWNLKGVAPLPYRLPKLLAALTAEKSVCIVEGEKDADRLNSLGLVATTNSGGAGKWTERHSQYFATGAKVILLPDNDDPGRKHAQSVARLLHGRGCLVKVINLPDLSPKGDASDWLDAGHTKEELLGQINTAGEWSPEEALEVAEDCFATWRPLFGTGFTVNKDGCLCYLKKDRDSEYWVPLANFAARIVAEITKDDGEQCALSFEIEGITEGGKILPARSVAVTKFSSMNWPVEAWGSQANIFPGVAGKDKLRYAIQNTGRSAARQVVYVYTGWRKTSDGWIYLHGGGAIGAEGAAVELPTGLKRYCLPSPPPPSQAIEAAKAALALLECGPGAITFPVWAMAFLAPMVEPLKQAGYSPNFLLWLVGPTMAGKSTLAGLVTSLFGGPAGGDAAPASFRDTGNNSDAKAFILKDALLWVDDFHPCGGPKDRMRMLSTAEILLGGYGDRMGRGRLTSDIQIRQDKVPRGLCLVTGEDLPELSQSRLARLVAVELRRDNIDFQKITQAQNNAELLPLCMAGYIDWLRPQLDQVAKDLRQTFPTLRDSFTDSGSYGRIPSNSAWLMIGAGAVLQYMADIGAISSQRTEELQGSFRQILQTLAAEQGQRVAEDSPTKKFTEALRELISSGRCIVRDTTDSRNFVEPGTEFIGWQDGDWLYLLPDTTYKAVNQFFNGQGLCFPVTAKTLWKHLEAAGMIRPAKGQRTELKKINSKNYRVIALRRNAIHDE